MQLHNDPHHETGLVALELGRFQEWKRAENSILRTGQEENRRFTDRSLQRRFHNSGRGYELNRELDRAETEAKLCAERIRAIRAGVNERLPNWKLEFEYWVVLRSASSAAMISSATFWLAVAAFLPISSPFLVATGKTLFWVPNGGSCRPNCVCLRLFLADIRSCLHR